MRVLILLFATLSCFGLTAAERRLPLADHGVPSVAKADRTVTVSPDGTSPAEAVRKIRMAKAAGDKSPWTVVVKKGLYTLTDPLTFVPVDSGTPAAPVKWIGEDGAVLSGGQAIGGWRESDEPGVWVTDAPKDAAGRAIWFESLYVNDRRADRSRLPRGSKLDVNAYFHTAEWQ